MKLNNIIITGTILLVASVPTLAARFDTDPDYKDCDQDHHGCYCCEDEYDPGEGYSCRTDHHGRHCCGEDEICGENGPAPTPKPTKKRRNKKGSKGSKSEKPKDDKTCIFNDPIANQVKALEELGLPDTYGHADAVNSAYAPAVQLWKAGDITEQDITDSGIQFGNAHKSLAPFILLEEEEITVLLCAFTVLLVVQYEPGCYFDEWLESLAKVAKYWMNGFAEGFGHDGFDGHTCLVSGGGYGAY